LDTLVTGWSTATSGVERIEVTAAALAEVSGDGQLSLCLQIASQPGDLVYQYRSREAAAEVRPQLVLERVQAAPDYAAWILRYPTIPPALRDPEDNPDQDDLNNAEEYLFGRNPALADGAGVWTFARASGGWALEFPQRRGLPPGVTYVIETGEALVGGQWQAAPGIGFALLSDMGEIVRMRAFIPEEPLTAQRFYRFRLQVGTVL
jgi:hypothetical protein